MTIRQYIAGRYIIEYMCCYLRLTQEDEGHVFREQQQENGVTFQVKKKMYVMSNVLLECNYMAWELKRNTLPGHICL